MKLLQALFPMITFLMAGAGGYLWRALTKGDRDKEAVAALALLFAENKRLYDAVRMDDDIPVVVRMRVECAVPVRLKRGRRRYHSERSQMSREAARPLASEPRSSRLTTVAENPAGLILRCRFADADGRKFLSP